MVAAENGGWVGHMGEVAPSRAFLNFFFGSVNASTAYPEKRGFSLSASKNVFWWWVCSFGVDLRPPVCTMFLLLSDLVDSIPVTSTYLMHYSKNN